MVLTHEYFVYKYMQNMSLGQNIFKLYNSDFTILLSVGQWHQTLFEPQVILGMLLFLYASWNHNRVHVAFANLRKDNNGKHLLF